MEVAVHFGQEIDHTLRLAGVTIRKISFQVILLLPFRSPHRLHHPAKEYFCLLTLFPFLSELVLLKQTLVNLLPRDKLKVIGPILCLVGGYKDTFKQLHEVNISLFFGILEQLLEWTQGKHFVKKLHWFIQSPLDSCAIDRLRQFIVLLQLWDFAEDEADDQPPQGSFSDDGIQFSFLSSPTRFILIDRECRLQGQEIGRQQWIYLTIILPDGAATSHQ